MASSTNVPSPSFGPTGFQPASTPAILVGVQADITEAFGVTLNFAPSTPQGQLASSEAAAIAAMQQVFAYWASQFDPNYAQGRAQDALGQIYFLNRIPAVATQLLVNCTGGGAGASVTLPGQDQIALTPATVKDPAGNLYQLVESITLPPGGGTVEGTFACTEFGPVAVPQSVSIYQAISGWDTAVLVSGVVGKDTEGRAAFEQRRQDSVAGNSAGAIGSIIGAVAAVPGVTDYFGYNNKTASPVSIGGVSIAANSVYICAAGGTQQAVAQAIFSKIGPGAPTVGNTAVTVFDNNPLYASPIAYTVNYQIPIPLPLLFSVVLVQNGNIPSNATSLVQNAVVAAASQGAILPAAIFTGSVAGNVLNVSAVSQGALAVGQVLADTTDALASGTQITEFLTGAGGTGTYAVSVPQTVASETMTATTNASQIIPNLRARIGQTIYATTYVQAINALGAWAQVASIQVGSPNTPGATVVGSISGNTLTVNSVIGGLLSVGQFLFGSAGGTNVAANTQIVAFLTGAGGTGTYSVSISQTVPGGTTIVAASANQTSVSVLANQVPQVSQLGVTVGVT